MTMELQGLRSSFRGDLVVPGDPGYEEARRVHNAMIDRRPAVVARCTSKQDVAAALRFARDRGLDVAIRGGGHNGAGLGCCDGGVVVDLRAMRDVRIDPDRRTATVGGGALVGELDRAAGEHGLATPAGIISTTGVGGLTLGGGHGYLTRRYGLTVDNLLEAEVVLADGRVVTASEEREPDLFWALRGGGGNFGVVISFSFRLHPVSTVIAGPTLWPIEAAGDVLRWYRAWQPRAAEDVFGFFAFLTVPPVAPFPAELHGRKVCGIVWCITGGHELAREAFSAARGAATPLLHGPHEVPYPALQRVFDGLYPPGDQWYWRGDFVVTIPDDAIVAHVEHARRMPTPQSSMHLYPVDGAPHRVPRDATAFSFREANWSQVIIGVDHDVARAGELRDWTVAYWEALHPYSAGGAYVNFMMDEGQERVRATYRENYARLARVKAAYDPHNLLHVNQNVRPAA